MATIFALAVLRARFLVRLNRFLPVLLNNNIIKQSTRNSIISQYCSIPDNAVAKTKNSNDVNVSEKPTKKAEEIKITLLLPDDTLMVTDLENANKISKRRGLILIKVEDLQKKTNRPLYKLISHSESLQQELENNEDEKESVMKSVKTIQISSKIAPHDLHIKLKNISKLLEKKHQIKIIVAHGSNSEDKVMKSIEARLKNYGTIQKTVKSMSTIFAIMPISNVHDNNNLDDVVKNRKR